MSPSVPRLPNAWLFGAAFSALFGLVSLSYPHGRDQGSYAYAGWRLLHGELPYRDVFAFKPPGSVLLHSFASLFSLDPAAIRVVDLGWMSVTALVLAALASRITGRIRTGGLVAMMVGPLYYQVDYWNTAQTDGWLVLPMALSLLLALRWADEDDLLACFGAGLAVGVAILFKYTAAVIGLPLLVLFGLGLHSGRRWGPALLALIAGTLLPLLLTGIALVGLGLWPAFAEIQFDLVPNYVSHRRKNRTLWTTLTKLFWLRGYKADLLPMMAAAVVMVLPAGWLQQDGTPRQGWLGLLGVSWTLAALIGITAQGKFYDYHFLPLLGPAALSLGIVLEGALRSRRSALGVGILAVLLLGLSPWTNHAKDSLRVLQKGRQAHWKEKGHYHFHDYNVNQIELAAAWLAANSRPEEPVFAWTYEPEILFRAQRRQVSRFLYNYPFRVRWETPAWEEELLQALEEEPPVAVLIGSKDATPGVTGTKVDSWQLLKRTPALHEWLRTRYCPVGKKGRYRLYTPKPCQEG